MTEICTEQIYLTSIAIIFVKIIKCFTFGTERIDKQNDTLFCDRKQLYKLSIQLKRYKYEKKRFFNLVSYSNSL